MIPAQVISNGVFFFYNPTVVASAIQYSAHDPWTESLAIKFTCWPINKYGKRPPPAPTTIPEASVPGTVGGFLFEEYYPLKNALSAGWIGAAMTLIRISPFFGFGTGIYLTYGTPFHSSMTTALMVVGTFLLILSKDYNL